MDIVPISGKSFNCGDSFPGDFWATRKIFLFVLSASSRENIGLDKLVKNKKSINIPTKNMDPLEEKAQMIPKPLVFKGILG